MNFFASTSFAFLFLIQGLAPNMDLCCELQKLPNLFEHYEEHRACNDGSFWQFLVNDYLDVDGDSQDHHGDAEHDSLPFQGNHQCCNPPVFYASDQYFALVVFDFIPPTEFGYYSSFHPSEFLDSPFQPPKA